MKEESEKDLQSHLIDCLVNNGYDYVELKNHDDMVENFKKQLKLLNPNTDFNFWDVLTYLDRDNGISNHEKLRSTYHGVKFIDFSDFSNNTFQVSQEITVKGEYVNRYDVTLLINGLPLVQMELKKSGENLKTAFNQIQRYDNHSYSGLFSFIQLFVISNKVHTRYFFNSSDFDYKSTYTWKGSKSLSSFTDSFLLPENIIPFLKNAIFINPLSDEYLMLRPYQLNAVESVCDSIDKGENGYVWMSYNSGKTITSLKLADILSENHKVVYIVRDNLTTYPQKFTVSSKNEFLENFTKRNLFIMSIRSLPYKEDDLESVRDEEIIFIFNEYEKEIIRYFPEKVMENFKNSLFYCFTSAPVFNENLKCGRTTHYIFNQNLLSYSFKDVLEDNNSQILDVEYFCDKNIDENYNLSSKKRIKSVSANILKYYNSKTDNCNFKSVFITDSNQDLIRYYQYLKDDLRVVPILRFTSNDIFETKPVIDYFESIIDDYNLKFAADISNKKVVDTTKISGDFERDIIRRFNRGEIDMILVDSSVFSDGYNSDILGNLKKSLINTVYIDCDLIYENLAEALSLADAKSENKTTSNAVLFRDLKKNIDKTVKLFSNRNPQNDYELKDYDYYLDKYHDYLSQIRTSGNVFKYYHELSYYHNVLESFSDFDFSQTQTDEFNTYKDMFNHELLDDTSRKKTIDKFLLSRLNHFTIDLEYIESINEYKLSETDKNKTFDNSKSLSKSTGVKKGFNCEDIIIESTEYLKDSSKICPVCGEKFSNDYNFCSKHEELVELVFEKDLVKFCPECGVKYIKDYHYCRYCESDEKLKTDIKKININPNKYYTFRSYSDSFDTILDFLTDENITALKEFSLSESKFNEIIADITETSQKVYDEIISQYEIDTETLSLSDKIFLFSKSFVKTYYKDGGGDLGHFEFNEIYIDDRAPEALQITTVIHELSHFIMAEIFEQIVSELLGCYKTDAVEAFVSYNLSGDDFNYLVDEYCAHTVEGRFAVLGYQDYGSYKQALNNFLNDNGEEYIEVATGIGNTFAYYIKKILTSFIDDNLRQEIKKEFYKLNDIPKYSELEYETSEVYDWKRFSKALQIMLTKNIDYIAGSEYEMEKLNLYEVKFKITNQG